ncbi:unnamed protein product, partial [Brachionus calyciflorus]
MHDHSMVDHQCSPNRQMYSDHTLGDQLITKATRLQIAFKTYDRMKLLFSKSKEHK